MNEVSRRLLALMLFTALAFAGACAFVLDAQDIEYRVLDGGLGDSQPDGASAGDLDASTPEEASTDVDPCDVDRDGFRSEAGTCGGADCDDNDSRAHPGAGFVSDVPPDGGKGDWNCDGVVTKQFPITTLGPFCPVDCPADGGYGTFGEDVGCGMVGKFVPCVDDGSACRPGTEELHPQGCH
jgi:hypothetical protein